MKIKSSSVRIARYKPVSTPRIKTHIRAKQEKTEK